MRLTAVVLGSLWAGSLWAVGLSAQEPSAPARRWSVALTGGSVQGGPAASVLGDLERIGWGGTSPGGCFVVFCTGPTDYPWGVPGASGEVTVRYALTDRWAFSVGTTLNLQLGEAHGYRVGSPDPNDFEASALLHSRFEGSSTWIAGHIGAVGRLSAGVGVGLHSIRHRRADSLSPPPPDSSYRRVGLMGETSLRLPRASRLFWELTVRGHWIPGAVPWGSAVGADVPIDVSLSYATITTGVGLRF